MEQCGYKTYSSNPPKNFEINHAVTALGFKIEGEPLNKKKGDLAIVNLQNKMEIEKLLSLSYYAN